MRRTVSGMEKKEIKNVVGVRFNDVGKIYHFNSSGIDDLNLNDPVIVETSRGCQIGFIALFADPETVEDISGIKPIERKATPQDLILHQSWIQKEEQALRYIQQKAAEMKFNNIKIISAEYSFDGKKLTVSFSSESDEKVDLKRLRQAVSRKFSPTQVDIRQIGPRDVAKQIGGIAPCDFDLMENQIAILRRDGFLPIVTLQYYEYYDTKPSPNQKRDFDRLAAAGAVIVQGSQSHVPQTIKLTEKTFIHYGLGNFFFDQMRNPELPHN